MKYALILPLILLFPYSADKGEKPIMWTDEELKLIN